MIVIYNKLFMLDNLKQKMLVNLIQKNSNTYDIKKNYINIYNL